LFRSPLKLERGEFCGERAHLLREILVRLEPARARVGVHAEITDHQRGGGIEAERGEDGTQPLTHDHGATIARARLSLTKRRAEVRSQKSEDGGWTSPYIIPTSDFCLPTSASG